MIFILKIDNKDLKITNKTISIKDLIIDKNKNISNKKCINIKIDFINNISKEKGYIDLSFGMGNSNNIEDYINNIYKGIPYEDDIYIEIYDSEKFLSTQIDNEITIELKDIKENKIKVIFEINHELINIRYDGYLNIENN